MSGNKKKNNKYGWDRRRIAVAVVAGAMALCLRGPLARQALSRAMT